MRLLSHPPTVQILAFAILWLSDSASAVSGLPTATPVSTPVLTASVSAELARGASTVAAITAKKYPYATLYRLVRASLEKNVQEHADSAGFLVGAHLTVTSWLWNLPTDLSWRERAIARHSDIVEWLLPRIGLPPEEIARSVGHAAGLTAPAEQQIREFLRRAAR